MTAAGAVHGEQTRAISGHADALDEALRLGGARLDADVAGQVQDVVDRARARLALGVDHTVVALVGGTGSGKSSLFNAVSGLQFADVGVRRPTTSEVTACVWGPDGGALLDWLGVGPDRRIERESMLDGQDEVALRGLVLLDLPDHDSIAPEHRAVVDEVLPQADVLAWVVDPQKYADDSLHTGYLQQLVGHETSMLVVLNQIDTVPPPVRAELLADVGRLLAADGLPGVPVHGASARTAEGVAQLRTLLATSVAERSSAARRVAAALADGARLLRSQVADREPAVGPSEVRACVDALASATGLAAVADAVGAAARGHGPASTGFGAVHEDGVEVARDRFLAAAMAGLPAGWAADVRARVAATPRLSRAVREAVDDVPLVARRPSAVVALEIAGWVLGALAVAAAAVGIARAVGGDGALTWAALAVGAAVAALLALAGSRAVRRAAGRSRRARVVDDGRHALEVVVQARLVEPAREVLAEHRTVRELVASAEEPDPAARRPASG